MLCPLHRRFGSLIPGRSSSYPLQFALSLSARIDLTPKEATWTTVAPSNLSEACKDKQPDRFQNAHSTPPENAGSLTSMSHLLISLLAPAFPVIISEMSQNVHSNRLMRCWTCHASLAPRNGVELHSGVAIQQFVCTSCGRHWYGGERARAQNSADAVVIDSSTEGDEKPRLT